MILIAWAFLAMAGSLACSGWIASRKTADRASALYNEGKYAEALPLLTGALQAGERNGTLLYQIGFCHQVVDRKPDEQKSAWTEARALLQKEIAEPGGATLERLYYLTKICSSQDQFDLMTQYARQGVEQYEKGPSANALSGDDWFRIGRLHEFLREDSAAEASYHRAVSAYSKRPDANPTYRALALIRVADYAYDALRLREAAPSYDEALRLLPGTDQIKPFRHALALLAADRFDAAVACFGEVRDEATIDEAQYGADLARKAAQVAPVSVSDRDGRAIAELTDEVLEERIRQAAKDLRAVRVKNSVKPGDPLPAEVADGQRRFVALLRERLLRKKQIQEFCLHENFADLVRR